MFFYRLKNYAFDVKIRNEIEKHFLIFFLIEINYKNFKFDKNINKTFLLFYWAY